MARCFPQDVSSRRARGCATRRARVSTPAGGRYRRVSSRLAEAMRVWAPVSSTSPLTRPCGQLRAARSSCAGLCDGRLGGPGRREPAEGFDAFVAQLRGRFNTLYGIRWPRALRADFRGRRRRRWTRLRCCGFALGEHLVPELGALAALTDPDGEVVAGCHQRLRRWR